MNKNPHNESLIQKKKTNHFLKIQTNMKDQESYTWPPIGAPLYVQRQDQPWKDFDSSVNAVSFGFVATAILISMFLIMAIFERFIRPTSPSGGQTHGDLESQMGFNGKLGHQSPTMNVYSNGVSVLMPGNNIPTFIARPAPVPCPNERNPWPHHSSLPRTIPRLDSSSTQEH